MLTRQSIHAALEDLIDELAAIDVRSDIIIYGGAAMALAHYDRVATGDVDAYFRPVPEVLTAAQRVAARHGLAIDWLNSAAIGFLPPTDDDAYVIIERDGVTISVGSDRLLLAMKLRASRPFRDHNDIAVLVRACGVTTVEEAASIVDDVYLGEEEIPRRGIALLERAFGEVEIDLSTGTVTLPAVERSHDN